MRPVQKLGQWAAVLALLALPAAQRADAANQQQAPADVRAMLEGTWELEEWHLDGEVLRPPEIGGRWSNHDGVVVAIYHRSGPRGFESFAGYGTYKMDGSTWGYRYDRVETARGSSAADAKVAISQVTPGEFKITREGDKIVLERPNDRREYDARYFTFMPNGKTLRKYRKVSGSVR
jgi:hypothetical protein